MIGTPDDPRWQPWVPRWLRAAIYWMRSGSSAYLCPHCQAVTGHHGDRSVSIYCSDACQAASAKEHPAPPPVLLNPVRQA